jgi:hypothetical protein
MECTCAEGEQGSLKGYIFMSERLYTMLNRNQLGKFILRVDSCCALGAWQLCWLDCFSFHVLANGWYVAPSIMLLHQMPLLHSLEETISPSKLTRQDALYILETSQHE